MLNGVVVVTALPYPKVSMRLQRIAKTNPGAKPLCISLADLMVIYVLAPARTPTLQEHFVNL